jgi:XTP/dITP diphosphohydrolase
LSETPQGQRAARFRCAIALAIPSNNKRVPLQVSVVEGVCEGTIAFAPRGEHGFGYDPVFYLSQYGCTMAELSEAVKNRISHRARAVQAAREMLDALLEGG